MLEQTECDESRIFNFEKHLMHVMTENAVYVLFTNKYVSVLNVFFSL